VCPECGLLAERESPIRCARCGTVFGAEDGDVESAREVESGREVEEDVQ
jgi:rubredoxin